MRLKDAKRPGIDAIVAIADAMAGSIDWLCGRSDGQQLGEEERKRAAPGMFRQMLVTLHNIEEAQSHQSDPILEDAMVGCRPIPDYAVRGMLHFLSKENLFPAPDFDSFGILDQLSDEATKGRPFQASCPLALCGFFPHIWQLTISDFIE